jgi:hypothetical protein
MKFNVLQEQKMLFGLKCKAHRLMLKVFAKNKKAGYLWRSKLFGNIHFADMNKYQLLSVIKTLNKILKTTKQL